MTREEAHDLMEDELRCVQRANYCDRDCAKCPLVKEDKELIEAYGYVIKALEQEQRWIPISERLPEDRREVLVTAYWHETYQVMMASYFGDGLWWCVPFNNCGDHMQRLKPKAWMPLPSAYKGGNHFT